MDARTVLALWADDLDLELTHGNAAELFDLFKKHGYQIIHRDENHGPTLERAAGVASAFADSEEINSLAGTAATTEVGDPGWIKDALHSQGQEVAEQIASAIQAMETKGDIPFAPTDEAVERVAR